MTEQQWQQLQIETNDRVQRYIEARLTTIQKRWGKNRRKVTRRLLKAIEQGQSPAQLRRLSSRLLGQYGLDRNLRDEIVAASQNMYDITDGMYQFLDKRVETSANAYQQLAESRVRSIVRETKQLTERTVDSIQRRITDRDLNSVSRRELSRDLAEAYDQPLAWARTQVRTGMLDIQDKYAINMGKEAGAEWFKYVGAPRPERPFCTRYLNYYVKPQDIARFQADRRNSPGSTYNCRHYVISVFEKPEGARLYV